MTNRNKCKQWFYTFPQTTEEKHIFRDKLQKIHSLKYYKIVQETHKDGGKHLHAVIVLKNGLSKSQILKKLKNIYPDCYKRIDVQSTRSIKHAIQYLSKEDTSPLESSGSYQDPRNPYNSFIMSIARSHGFSDIESYRSHVKQIINQQSEHDAKILELIYKFEQKLAKCPRLQELPEIRYMQFLRDRVNKYSTFILSKDDITFFQKNYINYCELL